MAVDTADRTGLPLCSCSGPQPAVLFPETIYFSTRTQLNWNTPMLVDVLQGDLAALRASQGQVVGTVGFCYADDLTTNFVIVEPFFDPNACP